MKKENVKLLKNWDPKHLPERSVIQYKYDGVRCIVTIDDEGNTACLSRTNKEVRNVNKFSLLPLSKYRGVAFDCEAILPNVSDFFEVNGVCKKHSSDGEKLDLKVFDVMPLYN